MTETETTPARQPWLYAGVTIDHEGDPSLALIDVAGDKIGGRRLFKYDAKRHRKFIVGRVYQLPTQHHDGDRITITFDDQAESHPWADAAERQAYAAASRASEARLYADKAAERMAKDDMDLGAILRPLQQRYDRLTSRRDKIAFELLVLEALRRGSR